MTDSFQKQTWNPDFTSMSLLDRARQRDEEAWGTIITLYAPLVYRWCKRTGMGYHDIENLSQEVFTVAYRKLDQFQKKGENDSFRGWLYTLVRNKRIDWLRKREKELDAVGGSQIHKLQQQIPDQIPTEEMDDSDQENLFLYNQALELIRQEFSERDQRIIEALLSENKTPNEIAEQLDISRNTIYIVRSRVLKKMRQQFSELFGETANVFKTGSGGS